MKTLQSIIFIVSAFALFSCQRAKEGDLDGDEIADILIKGNKIEDLNNGDNILIVDGIVVNGITNQQWKPSNGDFLLVDEPTFKMKFNSKENKWEKVSL